MFWTATIDGDGLGLWAPKTSKERHELQAVEALLPRPRTRAPILLLQLATGHQRHVAGQCPRNAHRTSPSRWQLVCAAHPHLTKFCRVLKPVVSRVPPSTLNQREQVFKLAAPLERLTKRC